MLAPHRVASADARIAVRFSTHGDNMKRVHRMLQCFVVSIALAVGTAQASTSSSEITDMWWNPGESGWGLNVILQRDVAFLTFFVYDTTGNPTWFTSDAHLATNGQPVWSGNLYATSGPWFGGPFSAGNVHVRTVGTATFTIVSLNQATLTYTVDGVAVTKTLERQTWTSEDYSGEYLGGYSVTNSGCNPINLNGVEENGGSLSVRQNGTAIVLTATTAAATCTYNGTYVQMGKLGQVTGSYSCNNGVQGQFALVELTPTISGFTGRYVGQNQYCQFSGYLGGVRRSS
jgi:hypothetical protein